jgi:hypothetical protein
MAGGAADHRRVGVAIGWRVLSGEAADGRRGREAIGWRWQ